MIMKYWIPSLASKQYHILNIFEVEKQELRGYFEKLPCRFSLSIEYLTDNFKYYSEDNFKPFSVSVHFIDNNWELKKKVINFVIEYEYDDEDEDRDRDFYEELKCIVEDWKIDKDICSIVVCDRILKLSKGRYDEMKKWVRELRGSLPLAGTFLPFPQLVKNFSLKSKWLGGIDLKMETIKKYAFSCDNNFQKAKDKAAASSSKQLSQLVLDPTFHLGFQSHYPFLRWGLQLKEALCELEQIDDAFKPFNLTKEEWDRVTALYKFGEGLRDVDVVNRLSDNCKYATPNIYFPKICHLYGILLQWQKSGMGNIWEDVSEIRMCCSDEFWSNLNLNLAVTAILDPRFKMDIVERWYMDIYGNDCNMHIKKIRDEVTNIYNEYAEVIESSQTSAKLDPTGRHCTSLHQADYISSSTQSELDRYLKDSKFPAVEDFDILAWWRFNSPVYPTLARMARDYFAIPIGVESSLGSSLENEILDIFYRGELDLDVKKALVLTKAWLKSP